MGESGPWVAIILIIALVAINGVLASAEIALVGMSETKLKQRAAEKDKKAIILLRMKQNPSDFLSTIQIGITLAGLLSGAFAADTLAEPIVTWITGFGIGDNAVSLVRVVSVVFITLLLTYVMLVFGELVPKRIAMKNPEKTARRSISAIDKLAVVTKPLVRLLSASTNGILRLFGLDPNQDETPITEEEILLLLREGHKQGAIEQSEVDIVSNLFAFTDLAAEDAMTHRTDIEALSPEASVIDFIDIMSRTTFSKFPVMVGNLDNIVGVVNAQDILRQFPFKPDEAPATVGELMHPPGFVHESKLLVELFADMKHHKDRLVIVVDEYGGTAGIITLTDIIEEIVGDIEPLYLSHISQNDDGSYTAAGTIDMDDMSDFLGLSLAQDEYDTLSGFVVSQLGYIPAANQTPEISYEGYTFQVAKMEGALIRIVHIIKQKSDSTAPQ